MAKTQFALMAVAIVSISLLLNNELAVKVNALGHTDFTLADAGNICYQEDTNSFWAAENDGSAIVGFRQYSLDTLEQIATFSYDTGNTGNLQDLRCYSEGIFILFDGASGDSVIKLSNAGSQLGIQSYSSSIAVHSMTITETPDLSVYVGRQCMSGDTGFTASDTDRVIQILNGDAAGSDDIEPVNDGLGNAFVAGDCDSGDGNFVANAITDLAWNGLTGQDSRLMGSAGTFVRLFNLAHNTHVCSQSTSLTAITSILYHDSNWLLTYSTDDVISISSSCVSGDIVSASETGLSTVQSIAVSDVTDELYIVGDVASGNSRFVVMNASSINDRLWTYGLPDITAGSARIATGDGRAGIAMSDADIVRVIDVFGDAQPVGESCVEIAAGGQQVCYTDTDGNGIPNFPNGSLDTIHQPDQNVTTIGAKLSCAIGFNDAACEDTDPKTNGVGIILLGIIVIVSYSLLVSIHIGAAKVLNKQNIAVMDYLNINPVLLLVMLIIDVGATWFMGWIPDLIFYTLIVVMGGMAAWGYFTAIKGRGSSA